MFASDAREVLNPYEWLPGYGESKISFTSEGQAVRLIVEYDTAEKKRAKREIVFKAVCSFHQSLFPGPTPLDIQYSTIDKNIPMSSLVQFYNSEPAKEWEKYFGYTKSQIKHFRICFLSENLRFEIFAESFSLTDEEILS